MRTAAILPVKRFARAKQRLGESVADPLRLALAPAMVADVLLALPQTRVDRAHDRRHPRAARSRSRPPRAAARLVLDDAAESGQSAAAPLGVRARSRKGFERVLCVPGDCPALDPAELDALLERRARRSRRRASGRDRARPPRHRHQRPAAHAAGRDRAELRARQLRAPPRARARSRHRSRVERPAVAAARHRHRRGPRRAARAAGGPRGRGPRAPARCSAAGERTNALPLTTPA